MIITALRLSMPSFLALLLYLFVSYPALSQIRFRQISLEEGLSQSSVTSIAQDERGFMWFGTEDGLNRYDGYQFRIFKRQRNNPQSLSGNWVTALALDHRKRLWVGTLRDGLNILSESGETFERVSRGTDLNSLRDDTVWAMLPDVETLWVGTAKGLDSYREGRGILHHRLVSPLHKGVLFPVFSLQKDRFGVMWLGTNLGLLQWKPETGEVFAVPACINTFINSVAKDEQGNMWVTSNNKLHYFDVRKPQIPQKTRDLGKAVGKDLLCVTDGVWIPTDHHGLYFIPRDGDDLIKYQKVVEDPMSLSSQELRSIYKDRNDVIWVGAYGGGINAFDSLLAKNFKNIGTMEGSKQQLPHPMIYALYEDVQGNIWVGSGAGLTLLPKDENQPAINFQHDPSNPQSLSDDDVWDILPDGEDHIFLATVGGGLDRLNIRNGTFENYNHERSNPHSLPHNGVTDLYRDRFQRVWIGTFEGLATLRFDGTLRRVASASDLTDRAVAHMVEDGDGHLWIGTYKGLNLWHAQDFEQERPDFMHFFSDPDNMESLSHNRIKSLYVDHQNTLWVGTQGGLNQMTSIYGGFRHYTTADGLPNNVIYGILEDDKNRLWLSTNDGLSCFSPTEGTFKNYDVRDGLQSNEFNRGAYLKTGSGTMLFGGIAGITSFHPLHIKEQLEAPGIAFTDFWLAGEKVTSDNPHLDLPLEVTEALNIPWNKNAFTLQFAGLHYADPSKNRYLYKLEGFDQAWLETQHYRRATYTNLDAGTYAFKVKAANRDGVWSKQAKSLRIIVSAPPWRTRLAYTLYLTLLLATVGTYLYTQYRIKRRLEDLVAIRVLELRQRNMELAERNQQLQVLDGIVEAINSQVKISLLGETMMSQAIKLLPDVEMAALILCDDVSGEYYYAATSGIPLNLFDGYRLSEQELLVRLTKMEKLADGIYATNDFDKLVEKTVFRGMVIPRNLLSLQLMVDGNLVGLLNFSNKNNEQVFADIPTDQLRRLREHMLVALDKAKAYEDLRRSQEQLVSQAHEAGMAEIANEIIHHLGNYLNSVQSSVHILQEHSRDRRELLLLNRTVELLQNEGSEVLVNKGQALTNLLERVEQSLTDKHMERNTEITRLEDQIRNMAVILGQQRRHSQTPTRKKPVDLGVFINETTQLNLWLRQEKNVVVQKQMGHMPLIFLEPAKLKRVLFYLMENAWEAIEKRGNSDGCITLTTSVEDDFCKLQIQDNGSGFKPEEVNKLFNDGYSTKASYRGFGLHYCANAMREMGGTLSLQSHGENQGTTAILSFPIEVNRK